MIGVAGKTWALLGVALLGGCASLGGGTAPYACTRASLGAAVEDYLAAQGAGDPARMTLAEAVAYTQDREPAALESGIVAQALNVEFHHSIFDTELCESFTELVDSNPAAPYVIGTHLKIADGAISEIDTLVTTTGDWLFNANNFLAWAPEEDWGPIPVAERDDRATLIAAGDAYLDRFSDESVEVPWGIPCRRLEGGARTGNGSPDDSCEVGVPLGVSFPIRHHVVDQDLGAVVALVPFGGEGGLPDSHLFRVENGKLRWVHTITVCNREGMNCPQVPDGGGFGPPGTDE
jgi:hypothetical protein